MYKRHEKVSFQREFYLAALFFYMVVTMGADVLMLEVFDLLYGASEKYRVCDKPDNQTIKNLEQDSGDKSEPFVARYQNRERLVARRDENGEQSSRADKFFIV